MANSSGVFVTSLDFELHWGVRDLYSVEEYKANLLGGREAIPQLLEIFSEHGIHATFATVGFLFARDRTELQMSLPTIVPEYVNNDFRAYPEIAQIWRRRVKRSVSFCSLSDQEDQVNTRPGDRWPYFFSLLLRRRWTQPGCFQK